MIGDCVSHQRYGHGVVQATRVKGFYLQVAFEDGVTRWMRRDEVEDVAVLHHSVEISSPRQPVMSGEKMKHRRMIEAFRLGIVPYDYVEDFTFGRDDETRCLLDWLQMPDCGSLLLVGGYGSGKSHLLHHTYWRALQEGYAVAYVDMDPNEAPFHKPKQVYHRLVRSFRYRLEASVAPKGFRDFLRAVLDDGSLREHVYFRYLRSSTSDEKLWHWIEAWESVERPKDWWDRKRYGHLPGLYRYSTAPNIYCYLLSSLSWAAINVLGLKGLLLLFDEAEAVSVYDYYYQDEKNQQCLRALIRTASDEAQLLGSPWGKGLPFCGHGPATPFLYKRPSGLKLAFAFSSLEYVERCTYEDGVFGTERQPRIQELASAERVDLRPLSDEALKDVFEHICLVYDSAYGFLESDAILDTIFARTTSEAGRTRLFIKGVVEALDLVRLNGGLALDEILG